MPSTSMPRAFPAAEKSRIARQNFTPFGGLVGGLMLGTAAALFLLLAGRISGISGILEGALKNPK